MADTAALSLTEFLTAHLDADEADAQRPMLGVPERWYDETIPEGHVGVIVDGRREVIPFAGSYPEVDRRTLATVAAHRAIVERLSAVIGDEPPMGSLDEDGWELLAWETLRAIASIYAGRDGYRAVWAL